ncbi:MAG: hypothetical protein ACE5Q3_16220 [Alphaproteobacteria bacterium]
MRRLLAVFFVTIVLVGCTGPSVTTRRVSDVDYDNRVLRLANGLTIWVPRGVEVSGGLRFEDIGRGSEVRVSYRNVDGRLVATEVFLTRPTVFRRRFRL